MLCYVTDLSMLYETGQLVLGGRAVWALLCSSMGGKWKVSGGKLKGARDPWTARSFISTCCPPWPEPPCTIVKQMMIYLKFMMRYYIRDFIVTWHTPPNGPNHILWTSIIINAWTHFFWSTFGHIYKWWQFTSAPGSSYSVSSFTSGELHQFFGYFSLFQLSGCHHLHQSKITKLQGIHLTLDLLQCPFSFFYLQ